MRRARSWRRRAGAYLETGLNKLKEKYSVIGDVRGLGMMLGVEFLGCGANSIRWSPPLILAKENVDVALEIFDEAIAASI